MVELATEVEREVEAEWAEAVWAEAVWEVEANPMEEETETGFRTCTLHVPMQRMSL